MKLSRAIKNAGRIGNDHEKGGRMKLEDTSLTTDLTIPEVKENDKFLGAELFQPILESIYLGLGIPRRFITDVSEKDNVEKAPPTNSG